MPTYDYECQSCGNVIEVFHSMSESPEVSCDKCKSTDVVRKITGGAGFIFKGTGFYTTDYKNKKQVPSCPSGGGCSNGSCPAASGE
jgi:putative FmdB family regulatory protein